MAGFLTFYGALATGAGWIVPKNYTGTIGSDKFKEQPIGLGPYRLVGHQPGVELALEANPDYWVYDEALFGPFWELGFLCASGPRAAVSGLGLIPLFVYSAPWKTCN
jgi:hypothetical protein